MTKEEHVFPGSVLTTAEEYVAGKNVVENEAGDIVSLCFGVPHFDKTNRIVDVEVLSKEIKPVDIGTIVHAKVIIVKESMLIVEMFKAEKDGEKRTIMNPSAAIPVFAVSEDYVKTLSGLFRKGDIVKAKVEKVTQFGIDLTTKGEGLGLVKAFCKTCRHEMERFDNEIKCTSCGFTEDKIVSEAYHKS